MAILLLLFLGLGERGLSGLRLGGALLELVHAARGVHELLLAGVERMAGVTDTDDDDRLGGAGLDHVAAGATDLGIHVFRMNRCLHKKGANNSRCRATDKREFEGILKQSSGKHLHFAMVSKQIMWY